MCTTQKLLFTIYFLLPFSILLLDIYTNCTISKFGLFDIQNGFLAPTILALTTNLLACCSLSLIYTIAWVNISNPFPFYLICKLNTYVPNFQQIRVKEVYGVLKKTHSSTCTADTFQAFINHSIPKPQPVVLYTCCLRGEPKKKEKKPRHKPISSILSPFSYSENHSIQPTKQGYNEQKLCHKVFQLFRIRCQKRYKITFLPQRLKSFLKVSNWFRQLSTPSENLKTRNYLKVGWNTTYPYKMPLTQTYHISRRPNSDR